MSNRTYYCLCADNCKFETLSKTEILETINSAIGTGTIQTVEAADGIYEINNNRIIHLWVGTQAEYNAITDPDNDTIYIISDDTSVDDLIDDINEITAKMNALSTADIEVNTRLEAAEIDIDEIESDVETAEDDITDVETDAAGYEAEVLAEQAALATVNATAATATTYMNRIRSGGTTTTLYNGTVKFNGSKTINLSQGVSNFSRIRINTSYSGGSAALPVQMNTFDVNVAEMGTNYFILLMNFSLSDGIKPLAVRCRLQGSIFEITDVDPTRIEDFTLNIKGIS